MTWCSEFATALRARDDVLGTGSGCRRMAHAGLKHDLDVGIQYDAQKVQRPECSACDAMHVIANQGWHGKNSDLADRLIESTGLEGRTRCNTALAESRRTQ